MSSDEQAIRQLVAAWLSASAAGDTAAVLDLMSDDVVFLTPGQPLMRGKAAFAAAQQGLAQFRLEADSEIQEVRVLGEWAYCWNRLKVVITPLAGGTPMTRAGDALSILRRQADGSWVIVRDANMLAVVAGED